MLGGSFDPAHEGHAHITREALKRFGLDRVWWLVSPANPLKQKGPAPLAQRMQRAQAMIQHPAVVVSDLEARLGTVYTAQTLEILINTYPGVKFTWLMGADNLASFHRWQAWEWIMTHVRVGVIARPEHRIHARTSKAARKYARFRVPGRFSVTLGQTAAPAWSFVNAPMMDISSTQIRAELGAAL